MLEKNFSSIVLQDDTHKIKIKSNKTKVNKYLLKKKKMNFEIHLTDNAQSTNNQMNTKKTKKNKSAFSLFNKNEV